MPEAPIDSEQTTSRSVGNSDVDFDSVCVDVPRIYDSCGAKDCLSDLPVFFTPQNQSIVNNATSVRINKASVSNATVKVDSVAFHTGFYCVDMVFYFSVCCDVYSGKGALPTTVNGVATYGKRVVLYGSSGNVKSFSSDDREDHRHRPPENCCSAEKGSMPRATVNISNPMALSAKLVCAKPSINVPYVPDCVTDYLGEDICRHDDKQVLVTLGIFTITQLERNVQLMIPSYDFCVPRKECEARTDDPCEAFSKIEFPTDSFFPPSSSETDCDRPTANPQCNCCN